MLLTSLLRCKSITKLSLGFIPCWF